MDHIRHSAQSSVEIIEVDAQTRRNSRIQRPWSTSQVDAGITDKQRLAVVKQVAAHKAQDLRAKHLIQPKTDRWNCVPVRGERLGSVMHKRGDLIIPTIGPTFLGMIVVTDLEHREHTVLDTLMNITYHYIDYVNLWYKKINV